MSETRADRLPRVALVTGANRGTGKAIAERLTRAGVRVWTLSRRPGPGPRSLPCDLADVDAVRDRVAEVVEAEGELDLVVANAVDRYFATVAELDLARWSQALTVNITSVLALVQAALPALRRTNGSIVLMGSHAGTRYFEGGVSYSAAKAAMKAVCESLLLEERPNGVRTTLISPGAIANEADDHSKLKMTVESVAEVVWQAACVPADTVIGELECRPSALAMPTVSGIDRLQAV
ncbi:SDR family NAD(P)-dependent oxidoreductase [Saccharopolyspora sp. NPDC050389]|uniref:SDR family oxidoreductase n=1 Tax=Saccharopolyspora sp. NPDC050389 TaxID=3155516 RepID=UPI0033F441EA